MGKILVSFLAVAIILGGSPPLFCAGKEAPTVKTIEGELSLVDSGQLVLTVKWFKNPQDVERTEKTFLISKGTIITKGAVRIEPADLKAGDPVVIEYAETKEGITVESITVKELPPPTEAETEAEAGRL